MEIERSPSKEAMAAQQRIVEELAPEHAAHGIASLAVMTRDVYAHTCKCGAELGWSGMELCERGII